MRKLITPENNNGQDWAVGKYFVSHDTGTDKLLIYFCDSYDTGLGYWMTDRLNPANRRNVSERAVNNVYWEAIDEGTYYWCPQWGRKVFKDGTVGPKYGQPGWTPRETA